MAATGHKTIAVFQRYVTISEEDLQTLVKGSPDSPDGHLLDTKGGKDKKGGPGENA